MCAEQLTLPYPLPLQVFDDHSEFVIGLDFNVHVPGVLVRYTRAVFAPACVNTLLKASQSAGGLLVGRNGRGS